MHIRHLFFILSKLWFFLVASGVKWQKMAQNLQKILSRFKNHTSYDISLCKRMVSPCVLFHFFKTLIIWVVRGLNGQKMVQNDKKLCLLHSISQEPYVICDAIRHDCHLCYTIIKWWHLQAFFSCFQNFDFSGY